MDPYSKSLVDHYHQKDLTGNIFRAFERAGKDIQKLTREDIARLDEFHIRGREATRELAQMAGLKANMRVLDLGSGVGGPARTLAAEFHCRVVGIDLVAEYCRAAAVLTGRVGLQDRVTFRQGDLMALPFADDCFDAVWFQHTIMNVRDKERMIREAKRVLRRGGRIALHEVFSGSRSPIYFPVPWAGDPSINFLCSFEEFGHLLHSKGFREIKSIDDSTVSLEWFRRIVSMIAGRPKDAPPALSTNLLMGETTAEKGKNVVRNLEEGRIKVLHTVWELPAKELRP
jgi:ubiquinone/menaquinone biosynthesis C-methylase UbiE